MDSSAPGRVDLLQQIYGWLTSDASKDVVGVTFNISRGLVLVFNLSCTNITRRNG
jgi:hypothetical protein